MNLAGPGPEFFVIGAGRSGTTSLHQYLAQHPQIFVAAKNPAFFYACDLVGSPFEHDPSSLPADFVRSRDEYERRYAAAPSGAMRGDVSPVYLASTRVAGRIARSLPSAKLIAILRDPVDRVYSRYVSRHRDGLESAPTFEALVEHELAEPLVRDDAHGSYLPGGMTSHFLQTYIDHFPREHVAIHLFEDFARSTSATMREVCRFLGVDDGFAFDLSRIHNQGGGRIRNRSMGRLWAASEPLRRGLRPFLPKGLRDRAFRKVTADSEPVPMSTATRRRLREVYADDVARLAKLTGRDLSHWR